MSGTQPRTRDVLRNLLRPSSRRTSSNPATSPHSASPAPTSPPLEVQPPSIYSASVGRQILDAALDTLSTAQRATLLQHGVAGTNDIEAAVEETYKIALDKKKQCDDKKWRWTYQGKDVVLRDEAQKVILWVDRFKTVGDVAANAAPIYAGLPWAGIRMILEVIHSGSTILPRVLIASRLRCLRIAKWPVYSSVWTLRWLWPTG